MPYDMPAAAKTYYELWHQNANKQLQHPTDWDRFYLFVSILIKFSKKRRSGDWLKQNLILDCPEFGEKEIDKLALLFDHLVDFNLINRNSLRTYYWDKTRLGT